MQMTKTQTLEFFERIKTKELVDELHSLSGIPSTYCDAYGCVYRHYPRYLKAVRVALYELGYDINWVEGEFREMLEDNLLHIDSKAEINKLKQDIKQSIPVGKKMIMDTLKAEDFVDRIGRSELYVDIDRIQRIETLLANDVISDENGWYEYLIEYPVYLKAIRIVLIALGYDSFWVETKFRGMLDYAYLRNIKNVIKTTC